MDKEIKLNVGERLVAMQLLPQQANFAMLRLVKNLSENKLGLSADEVKEYDVMTLLEKMRKQIDEFGKEPEGAPESPELQSLKETEKRIIESGQAGNITWNKLGLEEKPILFKEKEIDIIRDALVKLDKEEKLEARQYSLYEKFVGEITEVST